MGARAQVEIVSGEDKVYLYTHWGAPDVINEVRNALSKKWRWTDPEYLTRIIFEEMIGEEKGTETGYGIGLHKHMDIECLVTVNVDLQTVKIDSMYRDIEKGPFSFEEFINK